jgi:hypothetical protein
MSFINSEIFVIELKQLNIICYLKEDLSLRINSKSMIVLITQIAINSHSIKNYHKRLFHL